MTGRDDEPKAWHDYEVTPSAGDPRPADSPEPTDGAVHAVPDYGDNPIGTSSGMAGQYTEPATSPRQPYPDLGAAVPYLPPAGPVDGVPQAQQPPHPGVQGQGPFYGVDGQVSPYAVAGSPPAPYYTGEQPLPPVAAADQPDSVQLEPTQQVHPVPPNSAQQVNPAQYVDSGQQPYPTQQPFPAAVGAPDQGFGADLSSAQLLRHSKRPPKSGWRRALYVASGHVINLGESAADLKRRELAERVNQPLQGCYKIAMLSLKGGVGKTTATATLGSTFSSMRGDRVIAVDANPDRGTLSQKIPLETTATVRHLLRDSQRISRYSDIRSYTSQGPSRLEILASEQDPAVSEAFSEQDYRRAVMLLEHFYNVVLTDCGTGLMHSAMKGVLDVADSLVIVSSSSIDGARSASATLDWLDAHGYGQLVSRSVAVINSVRPGSGKVDVDKLAAHFGSRCRAVCQIPFDPHLEEGAEVELEQLAKPTRLALLELAATVADDFPQAWGRLGT